MNEPARNKNDLSDSAPTVSVAASGERRALLGERPTEPAPPPRREPRLAGERMQTLVAREERAKFRKRVRMMLRVGIPLWLAFSVLDVVYVSRGAGPAWAFAVARFTPAAYALFIELHLRRAHEPSLRLLRIYETSLLTLTVAGLGVFAALESGFRSATISHAALILMAHGMFLGSHWRRSLTPIIGMTLAVPLTLLAGTALSPRLAAQLTDGAALAEFATLFAPVIGAAVISLAAGHTVWRLRSQLAEAKSIGRYRLRRRIAEGGMGEIWAAFHAGLRRDVAVKLIQPRLGEDQLAIDRFEREVRALAELTHPNVIRIFDYGATETGVWYYAMELLDAQDLATVVMLEGRLDPKRAARLVGQAAEALGEAHGRGIVHRDIKPANLLLVKPEAGGEFIKLIDFGIAKMDEDLTLTQTGVVVGTPGFMPPEVITGGEATPRSDVYGLGMVLYVLLAGAIPYDGTTPMAIVQQALEREPPLLRSVRPDVSAELEAIVARCCARDPNARFESAGALAEALQES